MHRLRLHSRKNRLSPPQIDLLSRGLEFALFCFNDSMKLAAVMQRGEIIEATNMPGTDEDLRH